VAVAALYHRDMLTRLRDLGAGAVALDIVFAEPDSHSPERLVSLLPESAGRKLLEEEIKERPTNDALLAEALADPPSVLAAVLTQERRTPDSPAVEFPPRPASPPPVMNRSRSWRISPARWCRCRF